VLRVRKLPCLFYIYIFFCLISPNITGLNTFIMIILYLKTKSKCSKTIYVTWVGWEVTKNVNNKTKSNETKKQRRSHEINMRFKLYKPEFCENTLLNIQFIYIIGNNTLVPEDICWLIVISRVTRVESRSTRD